jgi:hypothetical protein
MPVSPKAPTFGAGAKTGKYEQLYPKHSTKNVSRGRLSPQSVEKFDSKWLFLATIT